MNPSTRNTRRGFTLVELIAVLVVLAILAVFAVAALNTDTTDAVTEAEAFKAHLRFAQARAMSDIAPWGLSIASGSYTLQKNGAASGMRLPGESSDTRTLASGVTLSGGALVAFTPRGEPCTADFSTPITADATFNVVKGSTTIPVTITAKTGYIP